MATRIAFQTPPRRASSRSVSGELTAEDKNKAKVDRKIYSKLAYFVTRVKSKEDTDEASVASSDSSLSSHDIDIIQSSQQGIIFDFDDCEDQAGILKKKKKKSMFERIEQRKKRTSPRHCAATTTCCGDKSRQKANQRKYSKIAFSVQNVGSVQVKSKKKERKGAVVQRSKRKGGDERRR